MMDLTCHPPTDRAMAACAIAVMAKASKAGRTKTRLCPPFTAVQAAELNTAFLHDISDNLVEVARLASVAGYIAYGPPGEGDFFDAFPAFLGRFEAWEPTFGLTLAATIDHLLTLGHAAACVLNADSPTLPPAILVEAARVLAEPGDRAVLGPASDGGYYLLGLKARHTRLFEDIAWSTDAVARQTLERAAEIGLPTHILPEWYDIDDAETLARVAGAPLGCQPSGLIPSPARHTRARLDAFAHDGAMPRLVTA